MARDGSVENKRPATPEEAGKIFNEKLRNPKVFRTINIDVTLEAEQQLAIQANEAKRAKKASVETEIDLMALAKISNPNAAAEKKKKEVVKTEAQKEIEEREENYKAMLRGMGFNIRK